MCALLTGPFRLSRVTGARLVLCSVDSCVAHGAVYSFGNTLQMQLRTLPTQTDSLFLRIKHLGSDMGEQQDASLE